MAPFPEAEIMTIKRLEVALRKMDFKLLKDGAYKLHEKYHGGHKFEYLDLLKDIYVEIENNPSIPEDVKNILSPTIEDILSQGEVPLDTATSPSESLNNEQETKPPFSEAETTEQKPIEETKISAFDAFSPQKPLEYQQPHSYFTQSPFSAEPFKEFNIPKDEPQAIPYEEHQNYEQNQEQEFNIQEQNYQEIAKETIDEFSNIQKENNSIEQTEETNIETNEEISETPETKKTFGLFYFQDNSNEKIKNILKLKEIISSSREKETLVDDLFALISEISTQTNTNVVELRGILEHLSNKAELINLITNSQSAMFIDLLESINTTYDFYKNENRNKINAIPIYGLSNLFVCEECKEKYFDKSKGIKPLVLECPKCKNPMYPDLYAASKNASINMDYYNEALVNLANSDVWLLIHPSFNDKTSAKLVESALRVSNVKEVYILDKDINTRESYRNLILKTKPEIKVYIQGNVLEDFFNNI